MTDTPIKKFEHSIAITTNGKRAIDWLAENTPLSRMQLKKAMANGAVWLQINKKQERMRRELDLARVVAGHRVIALVGEPGVGAVQLRGAGHHLVRSLLRMDGR